MTMDTPTMLEDVMPITKKLSIDSIVLKYSSNEIGWWCFCIKKERGYIGSYKKKI